MEKLNEKLNELLVIKETEYKIIRSNINLLLRIKKGIMDNDIIELIQTEIDEFYIKINENFQEREVILKNWKIVE